MADYRFVIGTVYSAGHGYGEEAEHQAHGGEPESR
jgi:hypothetical protein